MLEDLAFQQLLQLQRYSNFTVLIPKQNKEHKDPLPTVNASKQTS